MTSTFQPLFPLCEICSYELLHQARVHKYGPDYACFPEDKAESLIALSQAAHVPNDTPQTREFEGLVREFVNNLVEKAWNVHQDNHPNLTVFPSYRILPIGSFVSDTKIDDIDEFDYHCVLETDPNNFKLIIDEENAPYQICHAEITDTVDRTSLFDRKFDNLLLEILDADWNLFSKKHEISKKLKLKYVYKHGIATCIEIKWGCPHGHIHTLSIDISVSVEARWQWEETYQIRFSRVRNKPPHYLDLCTYLKQQPNMLFITNDNKASYYVMTGCSYEERYFNLVDQHIGPNVRALLRCLKILVKVTIPSLHFADDGQQLCNGTTASHSLMVCDSVSSHNLKSFLLTLTFQCPDPRDWAGNELVKQFVKVLTKIGFGGSTGFGLSSDEQCTDLITGRRIKIDMPVVTIIDSKGGATFENKDRWCIFMYLINTTILPVLSDVTHPNVSECTQGSRAQLQPYCNHHILVWCRTTVNKITERLCGVNIENTDPRDLNLVWKLVHDGVITAGEIESGEYYNKIQRLCNVLQDSKLCSPWPSMWNTYLSEGARTDVNDEVKLYLSQQSVHGLHFLLDFGFYPHLMASLDEHLFYRDKKGIQRLLLLASANSDIVRDWLGDETNVKSGNVLYWVLRYLVSL